MNGQPSPVDRAAPNRNRRKFLLGGLLVVLAAGWVGFSWFRRRNGEEFTFEAISDPAGFRRIAAGKVSRSTSPLAGLNSVTGKYSEDEMATLRAGLCQALFGKSEIPAGIVPVASFSDYRCPYCRVLTKILARIEGETETVQVKWHEWPLLGDVSLVAAKAALAARRQGAYQAFHARLMRTAFVPTEGYLRVMAKDLGIDAERLLEDMESEDVAAEIAIARQLAALFRFPGTPSLVVGRTVVSGAISEADLLRLIERERADGPPEACSTS